MITVSWKVRLSYIIAEFWSLSNLDKIVLWVTKKWMKNTCNKVMKNSSLVNELMHRELWQIWIWRSRHSHWPPSQLVWAFQLAHREWCTLLIKYLFVKRFWFPIKTTVFVFWAKCKLNPKCNLTFGDHKKVLFPQIWLQISSNQLN